MDVEGIWRHPVFAASTLAAFCFASSCSKPDPLHISANPNAENSIAVLRETGDNSDIAVAILQSLPLKCDNTGKLTANQWVAHYDCDSKCLLFEKGNTHSLSHCIAATTLETYRAHDCDTERLAELQAHSANSCSITEMITLRRLFWHTRAEAYSYQAQRCTHILENLETIDCVSEIQRSELKRSLPLIIRHALINCAQANAKLDCVNLGSAINIGKNSMSIDISPSLMQWAEIYSAINGLKTVTDTNDSSALEITRALDAVELASAPFIDHPDLKDQQETIYCLERLTKAKQSAQIYGEIEEQYSRPLAQIK